MYSIKTDLGVSGNGTIDKDLLVKGDAVFNGDLQVKGTVDFANATFTQITVSGTANLADISSTGTATLKDVAVSGNTVLGDASTDTVTVNGTSTFAAPATFNGNVSQTAGTASFKATSLDSLTVAGVSQLNGNLNMGAGTKATVKDLETDTLKVNGESILGGTLTVTGKTTLGDVEINGTLSGAYTMDTGNFNNITVAQLSDLNNVSIKGATTLTGNVTGANSTVSVKRMNMQGSDAIVEFAYNDPARPNDTKSSIEPYQVSTQAVVSKKLTSNAADIGVVGGAEGLHAIGKAKIDYLSIIGNSTIGTSTPQLQVAGTSTFTGKTTVGDLEITGAVTGLTFEDLTVNSLTVSGNSALQGSVSVGGNLTGSSAAIAKFSTFTVADGTAGNHGIIQFDYNDAARPTDIKSSIEPYKVSSNDIASKNVVTEAASIGNVGGTAGLHALGKATIDYLKIAGNSTIGTASPQLEVTGKSVLGDVDFTGVVTGLTVDVSGQDLTPRSVVATAAVKGATLESVTTTNVGTNLTVGGTASVTGNTTVGGTLGVTGNTTMAGTLTVNGQTVTVKDLVVTGTTTGVTAEANVDGLDIAPKTVTATDYITTSILGVTSTTTLAGVTVSGTLTGTAGAPVITTGLNASGVISTNAAGTALSVENNANIGGTLTVGGNAALGGSTGTTTIHNLTVTGTTTGVTAIADVDGLDIAPNSVAVTDTLTVTGDTTLEAVDAGSLTVTGGIQANSAAIPNITVSGTATAVNLDVTNISHTGGIAVNSALTTKDITAENVTVTGTLTPQGGLDLAAVDITSNSLTTTEGATIGGNLSVAGTVDLSGADVTALSFVSSDAAKTNTFPKLSSADAAITKLTVTGATVLAGTTASTLNVTGATTLAGVTATTIGGTSATLSGAVSAGSFTSAGASVEIAKSTNVTGDFHATGTLTAGAIDLSTTDVTVQSLESLGNAHVVGDLTVDGQFDLSATNLQAASLASTGATTVGGDLVLTTGVVTGAPKISGNTTIAGTLGVTGATSLSTLGTSGLATINSASVTTTLGVTGATTLAGLTAGATGVTTLASSGKATLNSLEITGATVAKGNLTVEGTLLPQGGLDLTGADIEANSLTLAAGATIATTLGVTGNTTVGGTLGVTSDATVGGALTVTGAGAFAGITGTTITGSGAGKFASVTADNGLTVTAGNLTVTAGNIAQNGAATTTASFKKTSATNLHVGTLVWDEVKYVAEMGGTVHISGDLDVDGTINAQINLTGRDISPRSITTSQGITVGTTLEVTGQSTMASAIIGEPASENNNLQINGNTVCTGDFTVQGSIIGTLDQTTSDLVARSVTASTFVKGNTLEVTTTSAFGGKITVAAGGAAVTGGLATDTITTTGIATIGGKLTVSAGGAAVTGAVTITGDTTVSGALSSTTLGVTGLSTLAAVNATNVTASGTLAVTGASTFTGKATAVDIESTGTITANNLTVTGTLTTNVADLVTDSVTTSKYLVKAAAAQTVGASWTPDGSSNVYNITLSAPDLSIPSFPYTAGFAGSWFIYVTQDATGGRNINWNAPFGVIGESIINSAPNSVSICQIVYSGVGDKLDVFIAQRNL